MITIILVIAFGILFSFFATQNNILTDIYFGSTVFHDIPVYLIVLASIGFGVLTVGVYYFLDWLSVSMTMGGKDKEIKDYKKEVAELIKENHKLELENTKLKANLNEEEEFDDNTF